MNTQKTIRLSSKFFVGFSIFSLAYVSILSILDPQATMNLVNIDLTNNDAISSIRGIYGGVGITIIISLIFLLIKDLPKALIFLALFWGSYAISRIITILVDGGLGDFGKQWLSIESTLCIIAVTLVILYRKHITEYVAQS
ncbi:MAG: DUF4345 domain-containing protein [Aureispira sp.]|nr:DUF4345 domain-containing protein [Aureispira sp.]